MSNLYRLEKLTFNNFKLFGEEFTINFSGNELVVFDGPNGHGKTTVYDAIELALTGGIRRFNSTENQQNPKDVVVAYKNSADCFVRLELRNDEDCILIERRLKKDLPNSAKKISNFRSLWDLILLKNNERKIITEFDLNELIGSPNLGRDFTLFHYVEQEDTAHFLKHKKEKERAEALSVLFGDTIEMQDKVFKVEQIEKRLDEILREKDREKKNLENRGNLETSEGGQESILCFKSLLEWKDIHFEWDRENIEALSSEKRDGILSELHNIGRLVKYREFYLSRRKHILATNQHDVLKLFIAYSKYVNKIDQLKEQSRQVDLVTKITSLLNFESFKKLLSSNDLVEVFSLVGYESGDDFLKFLKQIVEGNERNQESSKFLLELLGNRNYLKAFLINEKLEKECFLCGTGFNEHTELIQSIEKKELALKSILTDDEKRLDKLQSDFLKHTLPIFFGKTSKFLSNTVAPSEEHISELEKAKEMGERFANLKLWLNQEKIAYSDLLLNYKPENNTESEIEKNLSLIRDRILEKIKYSPEGYDESNDEINFDNVFKIYFDSNSKYLNLLHIEDIKLKSKYIQQLFSEMITSDIKKYQSVKQEINILNTKKSSIYKLRRNLKSAISRYQKLLIKDIEIPFYIYSGKVLQAHQSGIGNGIFIKDKTGGNELKNIRFVSNWKSDHDVINTMSSGQIAAVVITLYLALNKVYARGFGTLLIDDPVQTMDEINMISLVELLRNEFSDRQIILSTHEDHVSRYFIYKFLKYKRSVKQIKLLERKEYQLSSAVKKVAN
ncbi:Purine NTPase [Marinomonas sp. MED121]|uniref:AAA family ATPase n=1 Tax=Marinomonas sp. MED121 TaxID=314277 RepID=UPI0000690AD7|nr:AAA family ATPase [Marinomonas sp. MED121]EAQ66148.1 Purine NTPase [Marinomonas sp. MED121]